MKLGGLQKMTLIDFPKKVAATVFTCGCNFSCGFCHNPELIEIKNCPFDKLRVNEDDFFDFLKNRQGLLEGICITGGEPTIQKDLPDFIKKIKDLGFLVKLDTNGSNPQMLKDLFEKKLLDFVAMDIKSSLDKYPQAIGIKNFAMSLSNGIKKSIDLIKKSNVDYEFRTTVVPGLVEEKDIEKIGDWLAPAKNFALQQFQPKKTFDKNLKDLKPYSEETLKKFQAIAQKYFDQVQLKGL